MLIDREIDPYTTSQYEEDMRIAQRLSERYEPSSSSTTPMGRSNRERYDENGEYIGPPSTENTIAYFERRRQRIEDEEEPEYSRPPQRLRTNIPIISQDLPIFGQVHIREAYPSSFIQRSPSYGVVASRYERYKSFKQQHKKSWKQRMIWRLPPWHPSAKRYFSKQSKKVYREPVYSPFSS